VTELRVDGKDLERFTAQAFEGVGMSPEDAAVEAEVLVWANMRGVDSHGVARIESYLAAADSGSMKVKPDVRIISERAAALYIEGDHAFGPVVTSYAVGLVAEKAKQAGVGWALIRNTTHQGAMGYYTEQLALRGLAGIAVVTNPPNMAHPGTRAAGVHNSPISFAVPGPDGRGPLVLDMATSIAAFGKVMVAGDKGVPIPDTWALDADGDPTTDPAAARTLRPAGEYKGYGLALLFECFTSLMAANPLVSPNILADKTGPATSGAQNSFLCAVDVSMFGDLTDYRQEVEDLIRAEKSLPRQDGVDEVFVPGDPELRTLAERERDGVPMPPGTWAKIEVAAERFGLELPKQV
jgi:ureidoglycolate dehydrogenase (NAD+)